MPSRGIADMLINSFTDNSTDDMCGIRWAHTLMFVLTVVNQLHMSRLVFLDREAEVCCLLYSLTLGRLVVSLGSSL